MLRNIRKEGAKMVVSKTYLQSMPLLAITDGEQKIVKRKDWGKPDFSEELSNAENHVKFSRHAQQRLESRNIELTDEELRHIDETVGKMDEKGAKSSLLYLNDVALVVSINNRTVITALDGQSAKDNIFTNIDSAAIL